MNQTMEQETAALPIGEEAEGRERMLLSNSDFATRADDEDDATEEETSSGTRTSKRRIAGTLALFLGGFGLLAAGLAWFFGMGAFAAPIAENVDRTPRTSEAAAVPVSEEEKLKMALNLVAEQVAAEPTPAQAAAQSILPDEKPPEEASLALPGETIPNANPTPQPATTNAPVTDGGAGNRTSRAASQSSPVRTDESNNQKEKEEKPTIRTIYFGPGETAIAKPEAAIAPKEESPKKAESSLPFGIFLPVRTLGAILALPNSGSLVRMELTQTVAGDGFELAAGTVVVGRARGSELGRVHVEIIGLIDPATSSLLTFEGEVLGNDGAAGIGGKRRSVKSRWSKIWSGIRDAGAAAVGAFNGRSNTVVIADQASANMRGELAEMVRRDSKGEYVEVAAGTNAYVLVTQLPTETSATLIRRNDAEDK